MPYKDIVKQREAQAAWARRNRNITDFHKRKAIQAHRKMVYEYLETHPCVDCGNTDPRVLQFDHVTGVKVMPVSQMIVQGRAQQAIVDEIAKCEVRCANCHQIVTGLRGGWY